MSHSKTSLNVYLKDVLSISTILNRPSRDRTRSMTSRSSFRLKTGQMGSLPVIWHRLNFKRSLTVVTPLTFSSLFKSGFFPLFHPTGKFKIIEFDWSISWGISGLFFSAFWSSDNGVTKSGTTCASVCFFECSISISEPNLISWALFGIHEPVQSYLDQNKLTFGPVRTIPYYKWVSSVWRIDTK